MPRWDSGHVTKRTCPRCGGRKDYYAEVCRACKRPDEWARTNLGKTGSAHPAWKGGRAIDRDGYVRVYRPDHPFPRRGGYVLEHVMVMELSIGRRIASDENVHHKDDDKQNNALENLELQKKGAHSSHHRSLDTHLRQRDALGRFAPGR